jgi:tetratricopeptide (TPR) repeat protein
VGDLRGLLRGGFACCGLLAVALSATPAVDTAVGQAVAPPNPCQLPDALARAGATKQAGAAYIRLLRADPSLQCAQSGLKRANTPVPTPKPSADERAAARAKKLAALDVEVGKLCARGRVQEDAGQDAAARKAYDSALEKKPRSPCAKQGLERIEPDGKDFFTEVADWIVGAIPTLLVWLGTAFALFLLIAHFLRRPLQRFGSLPLVGGLFRPQLNLATFDDGALGSAGAGTGKALTGRIQERLHRAQADAESTRARDQELDFGSVGAEFADLTTSVKGLDEAIAKAGEVNDHAKAVAALLSLVYAVLPKTRLTVAGIIEPPAGAVPAATVSLQRDERVRAAFRVVGPEADADPPEAADHLTLAAPAAVWVQYEVANALRPEDEVEPAMPESFALTRAAHEHTLALRYDAALDLYRRAVAAYPENWAARLGQATAESRIGNPQRSEEILVEALKAMRGEA